MTDTDIRTAAVRQQLVAYVRSHPEHTIRSLASKLGLPYSTLSKVLRDAGYHRRKYTRLEDFDLRKLEV